MERIITSQYDSIDELIECSATYSIEEIHNLIEYIIEEWKLNKLTAVAMYALFNFIHDYLNQPKININFKNRITIPICYFSSFLLMSASILYSYLKTLYFSVKLFSLDQTEKHLIKFIEKENPSLIIFTLSQFIHVNALKKLIPSLHKRNLKIFIGGIPFSYDESMKNEFPNCFFPKNKKDLSLKLTQFIKEEKI